jgi:hypothetical protein
LLYSFVIDQNEIVNDVEPKDMENKCNYKLVDVIEKVEAPKEGMVFSSIEEVTLYYRSYGKQEGFAVVQRKIKKLKSGCPHWISLGCARHGNTKTTSSDTYNNPKPTTKTGCKAHFNANLVETKWVVTTVALEHNHALSPGKARYFRGNRELNGFVKRKLDVNDHLEYHRVRILTHSLLKRGVMRIFHLQKEIVVIISTKLDIFGLAKEVLKHFVTISLECKE